MPEFNENVESIRAMFDNPESFGVFSKEELLEFEQEKNARAGGHSHPYEPVCNGLLALRSDEC